MVLINTHLKTNNVYVQLQIIRDNIARLKNFISSQDFKHLPKAKQNEIKYYLDSQYKLRNHINNKIKAIEQTSFNFGGISTGY